MKKLIVFTLVLTVCFTLLAGCAKSAGTPSDEMKIPYSCDLSPDDGADSVERQGDHPDSPYFKAPDFYNMKSTDTLTILTNFKTQQQTSEWSCGVSSVLMMLVVRKAGRLQRRDSGPVPQQRPDPRRHLHVRHGGDV